MTSPSNQLGSPIKGIVGNIKAIALNTTENNCAYSTMELWEISSTLRSAAETIEFEIGRRDDHFPCHGRSA